MTRVKKTCWGGFLFAFTILSIFSVSNIPILAEEDQMPPVGGIVYGYINGYDMHGQLVPLSWAKITAFKDGEFVVEGFSADGYYEMIVPGGELTLTIEHPGYIPQTVDIYISPSSSSGLNFNLERSEEPIPEYPIHIAPIIFAIALLALLIIMRKRIIRQ